MKKTALCLILALLTTPFWSQQASDISRILAKESTDYMDFSYLVASELGMECTPFEAYTYCDRFGSFGLEETANTPLTVRTMSHFFMNNYGLRGGIMWSIFHNSRYAWKELRATGFWKAGIDPDSQVSGRDLVRAMNKFFSLYPEARLREPPAPEADARFRNALLIEKEETK